MVISLQQLAEDIDPSRTVLFFGSGSSIPSGAPSVAKLIANLTEHFGIGDHDYSLSELTGIIEQRTRNRRRLIERVRLEFANLSPTGGLLNLPLYKWRSIYTTNYDHLIEDVYRRASSPINVYSTNFDFSQQELYEAVKLFKIHGTIEKDISDGSQSRLILTESDYDQTDTYREQLYDRLRGDMAGGHLVIIGHSLADPHIKTLVNRAAQINAQAMNGGKITLLLYVGDPNRAALFEARGIEVSFGGIDDFFAQMARTSATAKLVYKSLGDVFDTVPGLRPVTFDVAHEANAIAPNVDAMFNGWPATHADVNAGLTFERNVSQRVDKHIAEKNLSYAVLLGASGVGKTTASRQICAKLRQRGFQSWEHKADHPLYAEWWARVAEKLRDEGVNGVLMIDDAHQHLHEINQLIDTMSSSGNDALRILMTSSRNHWAPRVKSPAFFKKGKTYLLNRLESDEVERLLNLVEHKAALGPLIEDAFSGFSRHERRRRLVQRCESETFVCLRNIFASENFDNIILREYGALSEPLQDVYRVVAAMENAGVHVHRQLVIRMLGISPSHVASVLKDLEDIILEYTIDERENVYGWRGRHPVIVGIIAKYKYNDKDKLISMFDQIIDSISPTYEIERRSIRQMCNLETGISVIPDKLVQNRLLRKMMSMAPAERVPRHRLVKNLLSLNELEKAETEIRIFEKDFKRDGPIARYRINLVVARATRAPGLMPEDRLTILEQARELAVAAVKQFKNNKAIMKTYCEVGIEIYRFSGRLECFDVALAELKAAESRLGDPDISRIIRGLERKLSSQAWEDMDENIDEDVD